MLYPSRDIFHFSEIGLFHLQWLRYCGLTSDLRSGEGHYMILNQLFEQDHSYLRHAQLMIEYLRYLRKIAIFSNRFPKLDERELGS